MNLVTDPWIPVVRADGTTDRASLSDVFAARDGIRDLCAGPQERIALLRLLVCVAQAALDGPASEAQWAACREKLPAAVAAYLRKWGKAFELLGDGPRFLQAMETELASELPLEKLRFVDEKGPTLFDQTLGWERPIDLADLAVRLVTYQSFAPGGTVGGVETSGGRKVPAKGRSAPCRDGSAFHAFLLGENLAESVWLNLATKEDIDLRTPLEWGSPCWEHGESEMSAIRNRLGGKGATRGYLQRLAPLSRSVWLRPETGCASITKGIDFDVFSEGEVWETSAACVESGGERILLSPKVGGARQPWRQLHAMLVRRLAGQIGGPLALGHIPDSGEFGLWVGAVITDQAKTEDTVESSFRVPVSLCAPRARAIYEAGVAHATGWREALGYATKVCFQNLKATSPGDHVRPVDATYWHRVEAALPTLFALSADPGSAPRTEDYGLDLRQTAWGKACGEAARAAYRFACPHETPRQLEAFVAGLRCLRPRKQGAAGSGPKSKRSTRRK